MAGIDATHDRARKSWVESANGHRDFPLQNLPLGIFSPPAGGRRAGVAIGDTIFDLGAAHGAGLFHGDTEPAIVSASGGNLNGLLALGSRARCALRARLFDVLAIDTDNGKKAQNLGSTLLHRAAACTVHLPVAVGNYTDFFCGIHHAVNAGQIFRSVDDPLSPNYKYIPVAYHGRASSVVPSGTPIRRPHGQRPLYPGGEPSFGPTASLDYEFELGVWLATGNPLGSPIPIAGAANHIAGYCLLNDWSARDIQFWESQPLGPFLSKSFSTTVSPWIVTSEALAPFRMAQTPRPAGDPRPMAYLWDEKDQNDGALDIELEALLLTPGLKQGGNPPYRLSLSNARYLYWTFAQMIAHHTSNGCNLAPGDLLGSGTISAPALDGRACLLESTENGKVSLQLPSGEGRIFLEDGDEIILRAQCRREGFAPIGFGECRGVVVASAD